jgi:hypothetical protein
MKYKVHHIEIRGGNTQEILERFLNQLEGEVISIVPNVTRYFLCYGAKIDFILVVEKTK